MPILSFYAAGLLLRSLICLRGLQSRMLGKYPWFYSYVFAALLADVIVSSTWAINPQSYRVAYWSAQFVTLVLGCGLVFEVFKHVLSPYPGAERFGRASLFATFIFIFLSVIIYARIVPTPLSASYLEVERDVRTAQVVFLVAVLAVIFHYGIPLGRNMRGMIYGYCLYVGASLLTLAFRAYAGLEFDAIWRFLQPFFSCLTLCIWLFALWAYSPSPAPSADIALESDYEALVATTKGGVNVLRSYLGRSVRD